jgi:murein DD-endopeptidase MepM/ murein hydrolase activator NlpD
LPSSPVQIAWPLQATLGDLFGPRGDRFHSGIDLKAPPGTPVRAAAPGRVVRARYDAGGYGNLVVVQHANGVQTWYAHLSRIVAARGQIVTTGSVLGRVGATGHAFGPHLHFEVRVRGAVVDPLTALD